MVNGVSKFNSKSKLMSNFKILGLNWCKKKFRTKLMSNIKS